MASSPDQPGLGDTAAAIAAADPGARLSLRGSPVILAAIFSDLTLGVLETAGELLAARNLSSDVVRDRALGLARALDRARARDDTVALALGLGRALDQQTALTVGCALGIQQTKGIAGAHLLFYYSFNWRLMVIFRREKLICRFI